MAYNRRAAELRANIIALLAGLLITLAAHGAAWAILRAVGY